MSVYFLQTVNTAIRITEHSVLRVYKSLITIAKLVFNLQISTFKKYFLRREGNVLTIFCFLYDDRNPIAKHKKCTSNL